MAEGAASHGLIICLIIQTIRRDRCGSVWTDEAPDVSRPDRSGADQIDVEHRLRIWRLGVRSLAARNATVWVSRRCRSVGPDG
jgi:hypothetical protein